MKRFLLLSWFVLSLLLSSCAANAPKKDPGSTAANPQSGTVIKTEKGQYTDISVSQLQAMLEKKDFVFVNVHIPFEGNLPKTDVSIPYDQIDKHLDQLPSDKNAKIVLYCRSDRMSNIAARTLADLGYTNLYNLDGGFTAWEQAGLPVEK